MTQLNWLSIIFIAILAAVIGSFLNMLIYRLPIMMEREWQEETNETFNLALPASHCPHCKTPLKIWHNLPLISFLLLQGKCAHCKTRIPQRYFLVELLSVLFSVILVIKFGFSLPLFGALIFTWLLIAISFIDLDKMLIPDSLNYSLLWAGLFFSTLHLYPSVTPANAIIGAISAYLTLSIIANIFRLLAKKDGMGHGDFKLFAALGAWLGWQMLVFIILIASITALVYGVGGILTKQINKSKPIPFGPFLAIGAWIVFIFHNSFLTWYY